MTPRERLKKRLADAGLVLTQGIIGALGAYRHPSNDDTTVCWETHGYRAADPNRRMLHIVSYDTMTACARRGVVLSDVDDGLQFISAMDCG